MLDQILYRDGGVVITLPGEVNCDQMIEARKAIIEREDFKDRLFHIWHFRDIIDFQISAYQVMRIGIEDVELSRINSRLKIANVSDSPLAFGIGRMYEAFSRGCEWEAESFQTLREAEIWLKIR